MSATATLKPRLWPFIAAALIFLGGSAAILYLVAPAGDDAVLSVGLVLTLMGLGLSVLLLKEFWLSHILLSRQQDELAEQRSRLTGFGNMLPNAFLYQISTSDIPRVRLEYVSAGVEKVLGITPQEAMQDWRILYKNILPEDMEKFKQREIEALAKESHFRCEHRVRQVDGSIRWLLLTSAPRKLPSGITLWEGLNIDVTPEAEEREKFRCQSQFLQMGTKAAMAFLRARDREDFQRAMDEALHLFGKAVEADRVSLVSFSESEELFVRTNLWCMEGIDLPASGEQGFRLETWPWLEGQMRFAVPVVVEDIDVMPPAANGEKKQWQARGVLSLVVAACLDSQKVLLGWLEFEFLRSKRTFSVTQIQMVQVLARVVASGLMAQQIARHGTQKSEG